MALHDGPLPRGDLGMGSSRTWAGLSTHPHPPAEVMPTQPADRGCCTLFATPTPEDDEAWEPYVARMSRDGSWGGHLELQAASCVLRRNIRVHQAGQPAWQITNFGDQGDGAPPLSLSYHDAEHYNSVRRVAGHVGATRPADPASPHGDADAAAHAAALRRIREGTGCTDEQRIAEALRGARNDVDQVREGAGVTWGPGLWGGRDGEDGEGSTSLCCVR